MGAELNFARAPHLPPKAKLSWRIARSSLSLDGSAWFVTGWKGNRIAVIRLPTLVANSEDEWLIQIENTFEAEAFDVTHRSSY